jgi:hypothetical protein
MRRRTRTSQSDGAKEGIVDIVKRRRCYQSSLFALYVFRNVPHFASVKLKVQKVRTDACRRDQYNSHLKKLQDYINDPEGHDNLGTLKNNPPLRNKLIDGRIRALQRQINNFKKQLDACEQANGM